MTAKLNITTSAEALAALKLQTGITDLEAITPRTFVNLLINEGTFETNLNAWTATGSGTAEISEVQKLDGLKSCLITNAANYIYLYKDIVAPTGNKIYFGGWSYLESSTAPSDTNVVNRLTLSDYASLSTNAVRCAFSANLGEWNRSSAVSTAVNGGVRVTLGRGIATTSKYYYDCLVIIDLTSLFGAGNEPTAAQMDSYMDNFDNKYFSGDVRLALGQYVFTVISPAIANYIDDQISAIVKSQWSGKTINIIGSSIAAAGAGTYNYVDVAATTLGITTVNNYGINGSMIAVQEGSETTRDPMVTRFAAMTNIADLIIVDGGTNDWQYELCPLGTMASRSSFDFYGALHNLCLGLIEKYSGKQLLFLTPIKRKQAPYETQESINANVKTLNEYGLIIKEVCGYYGIPVLDMYNECTLNPHIASQYTAFIPDGTHPNTAGHAIMAKRLEGYLRQLT